jgi:Uma2 family endonuclease
MAARASRRRMRSDEFISWAMTQSGRCELVAGEVVAMAPERAGHTRVKYALVAALKAAIAARRLPCEALIDGPCVRIDETTVYEPDALVRCGAPVPDDAVEIADPLIVAEVLSPSSRARDAGVKLDSYFRLASVRHYLIVETEARTVIHHRRDDHGRIAKQMCRDGRLDLDPPGIEVEVAGLFGAI